MTIYTLGIVFVLTIIFIMAGKVASYRTHPATFTTRNWPYRRPTSASSSPSKPLSDPYYVGPAPRPRHERRGEFPMMLPDEEAMEKEAALIFRNDLSPFKLEQLYKSLQNLNASNALPTYCEETHDWVTWTG